jgi:murein DD-endopeptidase MepM/ murein hydrolase activator NlpD
LNIIFLSASKGRICCIDPARPLSILAAVLSGVLLVGGAALGGFYLGGAGVGTEPEIQAWREEIQAQKQAVDEVRRSAEANVDALTSRLGLLQAHVTRLDALGQKLVKMAELDPDEFDFDNNPPVGGPDSGSQFPALEVPELSQLLEDLTQQIDEREQKLIALEGWIMDRQLTAEARPEGRPITKGWLSSYYGMRNHPISGKREMHKGIDFAGKKGSDVVAVASGVVTYSGDRYGYGMMVEIAHGSGYKTRYAHNKENLVQVGDAVQKGQIIAHMGSTGRSTGPHVHFEVLKNGRQVNPIKFIQTARK